MGSELKKRLMVLAVVIIAAIVFLVPTILTVLGDGAWKSTTTWVSKPISLGLDLRGGAHIVYEVQAAEAVKSRLQSIGTASRAELRESKLALLRFRVTDGNKIEFVFLSDSVAERARAKIQENHRDLQFLEKTPDGERVKLIFGVTEAYVAKVESEAINQAVETLRNRVDQFGVAEPVIQKVGATRILLQMPGVSDVTSVKNMVGKVAKLEFRLLAQSKTDATVTLKDRQGVPVMVEDEALMSGDAVADARVGFDQGQVDVALSLTSEGGRRFGQITSTNVGRNLAIILDGVVYSSPTIREPILGGSASISGGFTMEEARQLAVVLRAGALPAPLTVEEERTVGPSLGAESIQRGVLSILGGFLMIAVFMVVWYKKSGVVAVASLLLNLFLIVAILSAFGATLTLPGLAALALTIGVAVDSNVIIFERIKDEIANGATRDSAVRGGFSKAYSAIFDANLTSFITGLVLYFLGTGPVKGFAVSLCVGIVTTVFCAVYASRAVFDALPLRGKKGLSI